MGRETERIRKMYETEEKAIKELLKNSKDEGEKLHDRYEKLKDEVDKLKKQYIILTVIHKSL